MSPPCVLAVGEDLSLPGLPLFIHLSSIPVYRYFLKRPSKERHGCIASKHKTDPKISNGKLLSRLLRPQRGSLASAPHLAVVVLQLPGTGMAWGC